VTAVLETVGFHVIRVVGTPGPQGSKNWQPNGHVTESSKKVKPWRQDVRAAALEALEGACWPVGEGRRHAYQLDIEFIMKRPAATPKSHPGLCNVTPDASKLLRSTEDALVQAGVLSDDGRVYDLHVSKRLAEPGEATGCLIQVEQVTW
jgi:Holliday junction resolvase RusA-like endonuclease